MMKKKIALFQSEDIFFSEEDDLKYIVVPGSHDPLDGFVRVTDWVDVDFKSRPESALKEIKILNILKKITESEQRQADLIHKLKGERDES